MIVHYYGRSDGIVQMQVSLVEFLAGQQDLMMRRGLGMRTLICQVIVLEWSMILDASIGKHVVEDLLEELVGQVEKGRCLF